MARKTRAVGGGEGDGSFLAKEDGGEDDGGAEPGLARAIDAPVGKEVAAQAEDDGDEEVGTNPGPPPTEEGIEAEDKDGSEFDPGGNRVAGSEFAPQIRDYHEKTETQTKI